MAVHTIADMCHSRTTGGACGPDGEAARGAGREEWHAWRERVYYLWMWPSPPGAPVVHHQPPQVPAMPHPRALATPVPILLVEDIRLLRDGLTGILRRQGLKVVAALRSADDALRALVRLHPRLVLLDSSVGNGGLPHLVERVRRTSPAASVVVMDLEPAQANVVDLVRAGASGFVLKDATVDELVHTVRQVAAGLCVIPPRLATVLFATIAGPPRAGRAAPDAGRITLRERQVLDLIAQGCSNKEVAGQLHIAVHTVKSHVHSILEKLGLSTRLQLASFTHERRRREIARPD